MSIVVSDSTPLITLMKAESLGILKELFGEVLIPEAVFYEVTTNEEFTGEALQIKQSTYIKVVKVTDDEKVNILQKTTGLDRGESEAIIYANQINADVLLMDEVAGRRVALNMNLPITGSVGLIVSAFKSHIISKDAALKAFEKIRKSNRHISDRLIQDALEIIESY